MNEDFLLESYNFELPEEQIAQTPAQRREASRLLCLERQGKSGIASLRDALFADLPQYLPKGALLVANNARVLPARIRWQRSGGSKAEFLLLSPLPYLLEAMWEDAEGRKHAKAEILLKPSAKFPIGETLNLKKDLSCHILEKGEYGRHLVDLRWRGDLEKIFQEAGLLPLPPYIKREADFADQDRYQTIYASKSGALAAPTAGLHFSSPLRQRLLNEGFDWQELTLYVGYGTFNPVRTENILEHVMHKEYVEISESTAAAINAAIKEGRPVICVGTTSLRALEGLFKAKGRMEAFRGWTDIFIYPGFNFKIANGLITNFHLPKSSLLMLTAALVGRREILKAYSYAIEHGYRFFSYGDAMLIL